MSCVEKSPVNLLSAFNPAGFHSLPSYSKHMSTARLKQVIYGLVGVLPDQLPHALP